ncbi:predicted protein [Streptomyces sp. C]|nr:predicted protein [Streptomyces sp. C]
MRVPRPLETRADDVAGRRRVPVRGLPRLRRRLVRGLVRPGVLLRGRRRLRVLRGRIPVRGRRAPRLAGLRPRLLRVAGSRHRPRLMRRPGLGDAPLSVLRHRDSFCLLRPARTHGTVASSYPVTP